MHRRIIALLTAVVAAAALLVPAGTAGAASTLADLKQTRYGGADRYATSLLIAEAVAADAGGKLDSLVMVSGRNWTDAVVAAPLAGSLGAAVLATPSHLLRADATAFIQRIGVSTVHIVGADDDKDGVGPSVTDALKRLGVATKRYTASDQYKAAAALAAALGSAGKMGTLGRTAVVASGEVFADALVAGAFAARGRHPVLLTPRDRLHPATAQSLRGLSVQHVVLMGGTAAVGADVEKAIRDLGIAVTRLAGSTRYDTAVKAAELVAGRYGSDCFTQRRLGLARARVPFDSFSAGPLLGRLCAPLLLADPKRIPEASAAYLHSARRASDQAGFTNVDTRVFGGDAAVSADALDAYLANASATGVTCDIAVGNKPIRPLGSRSASHPAWSPDCKRIAYVHNGHIWTARLDGKDRVRLTKGSFPAWSPDGTSIAYSLETGRRFHDKDKSHIYVIGADGKGKRQITDSEARDTSPAWSADGERILFDRTNLDEASGDSIALYASYPVIVNADGGSGRSVLTDTLGGALYSEWVPKSDRISINANGLYTFTDEGKDEQPVWAVALAEIRFSQFAWSPDGCKVAVVELRIDCDADGNCSWSQESGIALKIIDLEDDAVTTVVRYSNPSPRHSDPSSKSSWISNPQWAPDGLSIAYEVNDDLSTKPRVHVAAAR